MVPIFSGGGGSTIALPVSIADGGTGQTTAAAALAALGGAAAGTHVLKQGTNAGNYSFTSTSLAAIDATNLDITETVAVGVLALALFSYSVQPPGASSFYCAITIDGTAQVLTVQGGQSYPNPAMAMAVFAGDGASHTFSPRGQVGSGTATINNASGFFPLHLLLLIAAS